MYRVQSYIAGDWHNIDRCFNEAQVIETMTVFSIKYHTYSFRIWEVLDNEPYLYRRTNSKEEFDEVMYEYNTTKDIPDISAVELKRMILHRFE